MPCPSVEYTPVARRFLQERNGLSEDEYTTGNGRRVVEERLA